jgi:hypothetical protein
MMQWQPLHGGIATVVLLLIVAGPVMSIVLAGRRWRRLFLQLEREGKVSHHIYLSLSDFCCKVQKKLNS